jgi:excisionase family DNA binding protein
MNILKPKRGRPNKSAHKTIKSDYLSVPEVADMLKMSVSHIYTLTSNKKIPHIKVLGKKVLFDKDEIKGWLKSKSVLAK